MEQRQALEAWLGANGWAAAPGHALPRAGLSLAEAAAGAGPLRLVGCARASSPELEWSVVVPTPDRARVLEAARHQGFVGVSCGDECTRLTGPGGESCDLRSGKVSALSCAPSLDALIEPSQLALQAKSAAEPQVRLEFWPATWLGVWDSSTIEQQLWPLYAAWLDAESRNRGFDETLSRVLHEAATETRALLADLGYVRLELAPAPSPTELDLELTLRFKTRESWLASLLHDPAPTQAPAAFFRLPPDTQQAHSVRGLTAPRHERARRSVASLLRALLAYQGTPERLQDRATELVFQAPLPAAPWTVAHGGGDSAAAWWLGVVEEPAARHLAFLEQLASAYADPVLGPQLRRVLRAALGDAHTPLSLAEKKPLPRGWPKGTRLFTATYPGDPPAAPGKLGSVLVVMPDGPRTWIGLGDAEPTRERLLALRDATTAGSAPRPELEPFRGPGLVWGGFTRTEATLTTFGLWADPERAELLVRARLPGSATARWLEPFARPLVQLSR